MKEREIGGEREGKSLCRADLVLHILWSFTRCKLVSFFLWLLVIYLCFCCFLCTPLSPPSSLSLSFCSFFMGSTKKAVQPVAGPSAAAHAHPLNMHIYISSAIPAIPDARSSVTNANMQRSLCRSIDDRRDAACHYQCVHINKRLINANVAHCAGAATNHFPSRWPAK